MSAQDPFAQSSYRRLIAWQERLRREGPLLSRLLELAPDRSAVDLGCGPGEHVAFLAGLGARAVGLDGSPAMLEQAEVHAAAGQGRFFAGDLRQASRVLAAEAPFGLGLCLGNVLPSLLEDEDLRAFLAQVAALLRPGGLLLVQMVNYVPFQRGLRRHLPLNLRPGGGEGEELGFLRLLRPVSEKRILFIPATLRVDWAGEEPLRLEAVRRVEQRPWGAGELGEEFAAAGFAATLAGDLQGGELVPESSPDLVLLARKGGEAPGFPGAPAA